MALPECVVIADSVYSSAPFLDSLLGEGDNFSFSHVRLALNWGGFSLFNNVLPVIVMAVVFEKNKLSIHALGGAIGRLCKCADTRDE